MEIKSIDLRWQLQVDSSTAQDQTKEGNRKENNGDGLG
jgi:hypothetical protein